jgi:hypothetical protein
MKHIFLLVTTSIAIIVTWYISSIPLWGVTQADISDNYRTIVTPASYVFSIWSVIYLSWIVLSLYVFIYRPTIVLNHILYLGNAQMLSALWLVPWHLDMIHLSLMIMILIFVQLLYLSLQNHSNAFFQNTVYLFFSWISVALIANTHVFLVAYEAYWQSLILGITSLVWLVALSYYYHQSRQTIIPMSVACWTLLWILMLQNNHYIVFTCIAGLMFCLSIIVFYFLPEENTK